MKIGGAEERWVRSKLGEAIVSLALILFKTKFFSVGALLDKVWIRMII